MRFKPRHQYDDKVDKEIGDSCATINNEPSLTQQQFTRQADVNEIVRRFAPGMDPGAVSIPTDPRAYGDLTHAPTSLRDVLDIARRAEQAFMALPAETRAQYHNDPVEFHNFVSDPANLEECFKRGVLVRPKPPEPPPAATPPAAS